MSEAVERLDKTIAKAVFSPKLKTYWILSGTVILLATVVGIPLIIIWVLAGSRLTQRHFARTKCELSEKFLKVEKGVIEKVEKNIPLDQITDLGLVEGPVMRYLGIKQISVETAGQSGQGPLVKLVGIEGVENFRDQVLKQRDLIVQQKNTGRTHEASAQVGQSDVLKDILVTLKSIEDKL